MKQFIIGLAVVVALSYLGWQVFSSNPDSDSPDNTPGQIAGKDGGTAATPPPPPLKSRNIPTKIYPNSDVAQFNLNFTLQLPEKDAAARIRFNRSSDGQN